MNNSVRQALVQLLASFGPSLIEEPKRLRGLLSDERPGFKREVNVLLTAWEHKVPAEMLTKSASMPWSIAAARLTKRLVDDAALSEAAARWAVESWGIALKLMPEDALPMPAVSAPAPAPPKVPAPAPADLLGTPHQVVNKLMLLYLGLAFIFVVIGIPLLLVVLSRINTKGAGPEKPNVPIQERTIVQKFQDKGARITQNAKGDVIKFGYSGLPLTDEQVEQLASFADLDELELSDTTISENCLNKVSRLQKIQRLEFSGSKLPTNGLNHIKSMPRLTSLHLRQMKGAAFPEMTAGSFPQVRYLNLDGAELAQGSFDQIARLPKLETLQLLDRNSSSKVVLGEEQLQALKKIANPVVLLIYSVNEDIVKDLESNDNIAVETVILITSLVINNKKLQGPPLLMGLGGIPNHPAPNDDGFVNWVDGEVIITDPKPSPLRLELKRARISKMQCLHVTQRISDKVFRAKISFVAEEKYHVTGYVDYKSVDDGKLTRLKFTPSYIYEPADLASGQDPLLVESRKATRVRRLPATDFALNTRKGSETLEMMYKYRGPAGLQNVEARVLTGFASGKNIESVHSWAFWPSGEERTATVSVGGRTPQTYRISGNAFQGAEPVIFEVNFDTKAIANKWK